MQLSKNVVVGKFGVGKFVSENSVSENLLSEKPPDSNKACLTKSVLRRRRFRPVAKYDDFQTLIKIVSKLS